MNEKAKKIVHLYSDKNYYNEHGRAKWAIGFLNNHRKVKPLLSLDPIVSIKLLAAGVEAGDADFPMHLLEWTSESGLEGLVVIGYDLETYADDTYVTEFGTNKNKVLNEFKKSVGRSYTKVASTRSASNLPTRLANLNKRIDRLEGRTASSGKSLASAKSITENASEASTALSAVLKDMKALKANLDSPNAQRLFALESQLKECKSLLDEARAVSNSVYSQIKSGR